MPTFRPLFFKTSLARSLASGGSETEIYLQSFTTKDDHTLAMSDVGDALYLVINPQGSNREICRITGINTAVTPPKGTGLTRGYNFYNSTGDVSARKKLHSAGEVVIITNDDHFLSEQYGKIDADQTWAGINTFAQVPATTGGNPVSANDLARKAYVDSVVAGIASTVNTLVAGTAGETVVAGNLLYLKESDGRWWKADADLSGTVENINLGIAQGAGSAAGAIASGVMVRGLDTNQTGLTANTIAYAGNTAGAIVSSTPGTVEVTIGFCISTTSVLFNPRYNQQITEDQQDGLTTTDALTASNLAITQKALQKGVEVYGADSVGTDAYAIVPTPAISAYTAGMKFFVKLGTANTGAATLAVGSGAAKDIRKKYNAALITGDLLAGMIIQVAYDSVNDFWQLLSPTAQYVVTLDPTVSVPASQMLLNGASSVIDGSANYRTIRFADAASNRVTCAVKVPQGFTSISAINIYGRSAATSGVARMSVVVGVIHSSTTAIAQIDTTATQTSCTVSGTTLQYTKYTLDPTNYDAITNLLAGDIVNLDIVRFGNDAADTLTDNFDISHVEVIFA